MNKDKTKQNISISVHEQLIELVEKYCNTNNIKKSRFIENLIAEYFKKESNEE